MSEEIKKLPADKYSVDFKAIWKSIKNYRKLYYIILPITFVVAFVIAKSIPNSYTCRILLAPEIGGNNQGMSSLASLASSFGVNLNEGSQNGNAIRPSVYPQLTQSVDFKTSLFPVSFEASIDYLEKRFPGKGKEYAEKLRDYTIAIYKKCADYALSKGIIIADTKFEFGLDENGNIVVGDEMLTPDSSRFWPLSEYEPGHGEPSFDKQFARDWLKQNEGHNWKLPKEVVDKTIDKYLTCYELLTGHALEV